MEELPLDRAEGNESVFMWAFDLIELDRIDMRRDPLAVRKATLVDVLARALPGLRFNEHLTGRLAHWSFNTPASLAWRGHAL
jgi:ATP-dependent DNA ligase